MDNSYEHISTDECLYVNLAWESMHNNSNVILQHLAIGNNTRPNTRTWCSRLFFQLEDNSSPFDSVCIFQQQIITFISREALFKTVDQLEHVKSKLKLSILNIPKNDATQYVGKFLYNCAPSMTKFSQLHSWRIPIRSKIGYCREYKAKDSWTHLVLMSYKK